MAKQRTAELPGDFMRSGSHVLLIRDPLELLVCHRGLSLVQYT